MTDASETLLGMAAERPDPRLVNNWLTAYLAARPKKAQKGALAAIASEMERKKSDPAHQRAATLVLNVVKKLQDKAG
jgi:hypothetical protein